MKIILPITPTPQARVRFRLAGGGVAPYKDPKQRRAERDIENLLALHRPATPLKGGVLLGVRAYLPVPASWPRRQAGDAMAGYLRPIGKPDMDNLLKQIKDCLTRLGFWRDDRQVVEYLPGTGKYYDDGLGPRWELEIIPFGEGGPPWK